MEPINMNNMKLVAWGLIGIAVTMELSSYMVSSAMAQPSDALWGVESALDRTNQTFGSFHLSYALGAVGVFMLYRGK